MISKVKSASVVGLDGRLIEVEVDISNGLPSLTIVETQITILFNL